MSIARRYALALCSARRCENAAWAFRRRAWEIREDAAMSDQHRLDLIKRITEIDTETTSVATILERAEAVEPAPQRGADQRYEVALRFNAPSGVSQAELAEFLKEALERSIRLDARDALSGAVYGVNVRFLGKGKDAP